MKKSFTEHEIKTEVSKFYNGYLDLGKCLKLFKIEYGFTPTIIEDISSKSINLTTIKKYNASEAVNEENLIFMKKLQEGGSVNMFCARPEIQKHLFLTSEGAKELLNFYMKHYIEIYYPEELL